MALVKTVNVEWNIWELLAGERHNKFVDLRALLVTSKNEINLLNGQVHLFEKVKGIICYEWDSSNATATRLHMLSNRYRETCAHATKRLVDENVRLKPIQELTVKLAEDEVKCFLRNFLMSVLGCIEQHVTQVRTFIHEYILETFDVLGTVVRELNGVACGR